MEAIVSCSTQGVTPTSTCRHGGGQKLSCRENKRKGKERQATPKLAASMIHFSKAGKRVPNQGKQCKATLGTAIMTFCGQDLEDP
eukprot:1148700-Pelagomonas_calceolata.AAC.6